MNFKDKVLLFSLEPKENDSDGDNVFDSDGVFDTLKVTGVNESVSDEMLRLYFENPTRSGGGPVFDLSPLKNGECIVKFQDHKGMRKESKIIIIIAVITITVTIIAIVIVTISVVIFVTLI